MNGFVRFWLPASVMVFGTTVAMAGQPSGVESPDEPLPPGALFRFGSARFQHGAEIINSVLSPDGKFLATASGRSVAVWDLATSRRTHLFPCDRGTHFVSPGLAFSPDGKRLGYVPKYDFACVWDLTAGKEIWRCEENRRGSHNFCYFTPDGKEFALTDQARTRFWDPMSGKETRSRPVKYVTRLSPDGKSFARVEVKRSLVLGDFPTGAEKSRWEVGSEYGPNNLAYSPDGKSLAVVDQLKEIQIRDIPDGRIRRKFPFPVPDPARLRFQEKDRAYDYQVAFSGDGKRLLFGTAEGTVHRWDLTTRHKLAPLDAHLGPVTGMHALPDVRAFVTTGMDGLIRIWNEKDARPVTEPGRYRGRTCAAYSPDGRFVAVGDAQGRVDQWDVAARKRLAELCPKGPAVSRLAFAPDGKSVAAGLLTREVRLWEVPSGRVGKVLRAKSDGWGFADTLLFSPDGRFLYAGERPDAMWLWEVATGKLVRREEGECASAFSPDGGTLAVAEGGPFLSLRDAATGKRRVRILLNINADEQRGNVVSAVAFSPDGRWLAVALWDGEISLCDASTGFERKRFLAVDVRPKSIYETRWEAAHQVVCLVFSPDGRLLLTGSTDSSVRLWEVATGKQVLRRNGHEGPITQVAFGRGGRTLLSGGGDAQAYLWSARPPSGAGPRPSPEELWAELGGQDVTVAYRAVWALSDAKSAADFLRRGIAPVKPADSALVKKRIADLNNAQFKVRSEATRTLAEMGDLAGQAMEAELKKKPALETEQRLRKLLGALNREPTPAELARMRAVQALELTGTPEARAVLREWAGGAPGARLTEDSRAALARLRKGDAAGKWNP